MNKLNEAAGLSLEEFAAEIETEDCPEHVFSDEFEHNMGGIIKKRRRGGYTFAKINKKAFIVLVAAAIAVTLTVTVGAIKQGGIDKFIKYGFSEPPASDNVKRSGNRKTEYEPQKKIRGDKSERLVTDNDPKFWKYKLIDSEDGGDKKIMLTEYKGEAKYLEVPAELDGHVVSAIDSFAFYKNPRLKKLHITDTITKLNQYAVYGCKNLKKIIIENSVREISEKAVGYYYDKESDSDLLLDNLTISCGKYSSAYNYARDNMFTFEVDEISEVSEWTYTGSGDGVVITGYHREESKVVVPLKIKGQKVVGIAENAFKDNKYINEITLFKYVESVENGAFYGCENLTTVRISNKTIGLSPMAFASDFKAEDGTYPYYKFNDSFTIYSYANSSAYVYAKQYGLSFVDLEKENASSEAAVSSGGNEISSGSGHSSSSSVEDNSKTSSVKENVSSSVPAAGKTNNVTSDDWDLLR